MHEALIMVVVMVEMAEAGHPTPSVVVIIFSLLLQNLILPTINDVPVKSATKQVMWPYSVDIASITAISMLLPLPSLRISQVPLTYLAPLGTQTKQQATISLMVLPTSISPLSCTVVVNKFGFEMARAIHTKHW